MKLTPEELKEFKKRVSDFYSTPIMLIGKINTSEEVWKRVEQYMKEMGDKYGYDPQKYAIHMAEGEILTLEEAQERDKQEGRGS